MEKFACGVEDAKALRSRVVATVHVSGTLERLAQIGEPAVFAICGLTQPRLVARKALGAWGSRDYIVTQPIPKPFCHDIAKIQIRDSVLLSERMDRLKAPI